MKNFMSYFAVAITLFLASCTAEISNNTITYTKAIPEYREQLNLKQEIVTEPARAIEDAGKVYVGDDYLLIMEENEGIHVVDNSNILNPVNISFVKVPGITEFAVKDRSIYANNYLSLVTLDFSNINDFTVIDHNFNGLLPQGAKSLEVDGQVLVGFKFEEVTEKLEKGDNIWDFVSQGHNTLYFDKFDNIIAPSVVESSFIGAADGSQGTTNRMIVDETGIYLLKKRALVEYSHDLQMVQEYNLSVTAQTLFDYEDKLYIGSETDMIVYNKENGQLAQDGNFRHETACDPVLPASTSVAYVTVRSGGNCAGDENLLYVVDTDNYRELGRRELYQPAGMTRVNNTLFVAQGTNGLTAYDVSDLTNPIELYQRNDIIAYDVLGNISTGSLMISNDTSIDYYSINEDGTITLVSNLDF